MTSRLRRLRRRTGEQGVAAIMMAVTMVALLVASAMVLDFGLVRIDRQVDRSAADSAVFAGLAGMSSSDGKPHPYLGVCNALRYLRANDGRFSGVTSATGTWTDGNGATTGNGCTDTTLQGKVCTPGDTSTWAKYTWGPSSGITVQIQGGYQLSSASGWNEDSLPAATADQDDTAQGCDQLAVTITQSRKPGLGSIARSSDLTTSVRSVGRVKLGAGGDAPAMLLLKRSGCPVLNTGGSGGGSFIHVLGAVSSTGRSQPGTIHSDADGSACSGGSNANIFLGRANDGIVAYAAPLASNPTVADPSQPGLITSVAGANGYAGTSPVISDGAGSWVYASGAINPSGAAAATKAAPTGRTIVTRKPVDDRYLAGVSSIVATAQGTVFASLTAANAAGAGYTVVSNCNPTGSITATMVFVDCTDNNGYKGTATFTNATTVVFNGRLNPSGTISLPVATKVYVFGVSGKPAIEIGNGATLSLHAAGNLSGTSCSDSQSPIATNKAVLVVKDGPIKQTGGTLQMCRTTAVLMGGQGDACLPTLGYTTTPPPYAKPCALSTPTPVTGTGQLTQTGGTVDWTAPNQWDVMTLANGDPDPARAPSWSDPNGPEDLAFWSESGVDSSNTYNMAGGGNLHTVGVYMVPNADPFIISGGANQVLTNAQYIASSISLNGNGTSITMSVDANAAVTLPKLAPMGLVR